MNYVFECDINACHIGLEEAHGKARDLSEDETQEKAKKEERERKKKVAKAQSTDGDKMREDCIFCRIIEHKAPAKFIFEDEDCVAFWDIHPIAPVHCLVVPRKHIESLADADVLDKAVLGSLMLGIKRVAIELDLVSKGFRTIINTGALAGQSVFHLHCHVISGRRFSWP